MDTREALIQGIHQPRKRDGSGPSCLRAGTARLDEARSNQTGAQQERAHFEQQEKNALAQIDKTYAGVTGASEVFQWYVRDAEVVSAWVGIELNRQEGCTVRQVRAWQQTLWDLLHHRADDHAHAVLNVSDNISPGHESSAI
ncbi:hypothetical protein [Burkholderia gladioli]|uniref:hypothetical protein n=1 Tax=Burkholderia gladioli TaxID=28095 RepID=UPI000F51B79A|nr:hypothetical protein [Burkholderia gladioli]MDN7466120.1 hypothetical protein [Burkholderia gladioli]